LQEVQTFCKLVSYLVSLIAECALRGRSFLRVYTVAATLPVRRLGYSSIEGASLVEDGDEVIVDQGQRHLQRPQLRAPRQHLELIVSCQPTFPYIL
jgi:hypothetical protein